MTKPTVDSINTNAEWFFAGFTRVTGTEINEEDRAPHSGRTRYLYIPKSLAGRRSSGWGEPTATGCRDNTDSARPRVLPHHRYLPARGVGVASDLERPEGGRAKYQ